MQIYSKLAGQFGQHAIDNALHSLTSEAHLYTTTGASSLCGDAVAGWKLLYKQNSSVASSLFKLH